MWHTHQHSAVVRSEVVALRATAFDHTAELLTDLAAHVCVCVCVRVCACVRVSCCGWCVGAAHLSSWPSEPCRSCCTHTRTRRMSHSRILYALPTCVNADSQP
jgi:hypothetical protein